MTSAQLIADTIAHIGEDPKKDCGWSFRQLRLFITHLTQSQDEARSAKARINDACADYMKINEKLKSVRQAAKEDEEAYARGNAKLYWELQAVKADLTKAREENEQLMIMDYWHDRAKTAEKRVKELEAQIGQTT